MICIAYLDGFDRWDLLIEQAEFHGMTPLLWHHVKNGGFSIRIRQKHLLKVLAYRHRHANEIRLNILSKVLFLFQEEGIDVAPALRSAPFHRGGDWDCSLRQEKTTISLSVSRVCTALAPLAAVIVPEFSAEVSGWANVESLSVMTATQSLMMQCIHYQKEREQTIGRLLETAKKCRSYRLLYSDPEAAVDCRLQLFPF